MKKLIKKTAIAICFSAAIALAFGATKDVSAKAKFSYKLKKGTLTIKGKGDMPKKKNFKNNKKIKKVVIKKGVKSLPNNVFRNCKKLKTVSIPSTVKKIGANAFSNTALKKLVIPKKTTKLGTGFANNCKNLDYLTLPGDFVILNASGKEQNTYSMNGTYLIQVKFNSALNIKNCGYFKTLNFLTSANDNAFTTIDGVVYTKDGAGIVRVPSERTAITLSDGCKTLYTAAISYKGQGMRENACKNLGNVTIPASVTKITDEQYNDLAYIHTATSKANFKFADQSKLTIDDFVKLKNVFYIKPAKLASMLPTRIQLDDENKVYVGDTKYLVAGADGDDVTIPEGIEIICEKAFANYNFTSAVNDSEDGLVIPEGVKEIRDNAFASSNLSKVKLPESIVSIGKKAFYSTSITDIVIPKSISTISNGLFESSSLKNIVFDGKVTSFGKSAFASTKVNINEVLKVEGLKTIGDKAFFCVPFKNVTVPATIDTVGEYVFDFDANSDKKYVTFDGATDGINPFAFGRLDYHLGTLTFTQGMPQAFSCADAYRFNKSKKYYSIDLYWIKVSDATGYEIKLSTNKAGTKGLKKATAKYNENNKSISVKKSAKHKYAFVRPYKLEGSKKVYGKWSMDEIK